MSELADLRRRLKAAKRRATYWSGRPSFCNFGFRPGSRGRGDHPDLEYEKAMDDCHLLADAIASRTGKRPVVRDVKEDFRAAAAKWPTRSPN